MTNNQVNINTYLIEYLKEHKATFVVFCLLLTTYPLQRITIPKYYGKVIASLNKGENNLFVNNVKWLIIFYIIVQLFSAMIHKVQGLLVPNFLEFSVQRIFSHLLNNK